MWLSGTSQHFDISSLRLSCRIIFISMIITLKSKSTTAGIVDSMLAVKGDPACDRNDVSKNYIFNDGSDYFKSKFSSLARISQEQSRNLRDKSFTETEPPSSSDVTQAINLIKQTDTLGILTEIKVMLGFANTPYHCYNTKGTLVQCTKGDRSEFKAVEQVWSIRYDCDGWKAILDSPSVRFSIGNLYKVMIRLTLNIQQIDVNQCPDSSDVEFSGTALCPPATSTCTHVGGKGFVVGSYTCKCNNCATCVVVDGEDLVSTINPAEYMMEACNGTIPKVVTTTTSGNIGKPPSATGTTPSPSGPDGHVSSGTTTTLSSCLFQNDQDCLKAYIFLAFQGLCAVTCLIFAIVVTVYRAEPVIQAAKYLILLIILFGAVLIYSTLLLRFFAASDLMCYIHPWLREIGFMCLYGAILLKLYKFLAEFQTRKARRVHIRDKDLLKYWMSCLLIVIIYLTAWTALNINYAAIQNTTLVTSVTNSDGELQKQCINTGWNYVTQITELIFLAFGIYMSYRLRSAPSSFWESRFYTAVLVIEFSISLVYYILIAVLKLSLYWMFVASFAHTQLTITLGLFLIFAPKFHFIRHCPKESAFLSRPSGNNTDLVDFRTHGKSSATNGDIDLDDINIAEMDPDDIRKELRRVYEQLQTLKVKVMRYENPHLHGKKSKLPFYKQISKHGFHQKKGRASEIEIDITAADPVELEHLNADKEQHGKQDSKPSSSHQITI